MGNNNAAKMGCQRPVSEKEINRNNAVYGIQKNRNPFVDYPGLEQYIWGNKQDVPFSYDNYDKPTGIYDIPTVEAQRIVRVYTISGTMVRTADSEANALDGLAKGMYIVNGKKYVVN